MTAPATAVWDDFVVPDDARRGRVTLNLHDHLAAYVPRRPAAYLRISSDRFGLEAGVDRQQEDVDDTRKRLRWPEFTRVYKENDTSAFKKTAAGASALRSIDYPRHPADPSGSSPPLALAAKPAGAEGASDALLDAFGFCGAVSPGALGYDDAGVIAVGPGVAQELARNRDRGVLEESW